MRIETVYVENFQGLRHANLTLSAPITMVCGLNGAGKSSLKEAIGLALGESARISLKKDWGKLVTEGEKKAQIIVGHDGVASSITLPNGKADRTEVAGQEYLPYVLNPEAFAKLDDKARRSLLFALTKSSGKPAVVVEKLLARGADAAKVEKIKPLLLSGFNAAMEQAKTYTSESRGAWKSLTGEAYGSDKADGWMVTIEPLAEGVPEVTQEDLAQALADYNSAVDHISKGDQYLGEQRAQRKNSDNAATKKAALEEVFSQLPRRKAKLDATNTDLQSWKEKIASAQVKLNAHSGEASCDCPGCGVKLKVVGKGIELFKGKTADLNKQAAAKLELQKATEAYNLMLRTQTNDQKAVAESEQAGRDLEALAASTGEEVTDAMIQRTVDAIQVQRNLRDAANAKVEAMRERIDLIANAEQKARQASEYHADVKAWELVAKALAPDGIPGEILAGALEPINKSLAKLSTIAGWPVVSIATDMTITAAGRLYTLLSESERWRCDALIGLAIAIASGLRLIVLDRFDVLLPAVRAQLLGSLINLAKSGDIETAIVCGSLKEKPARLPPEINAVWIEGGVAGGDAEFNSLL
ncbi:AAA family ATPase [Pseudomonas helleri]|uniref:AAA family ATPase n=1 Tax=Pseudomonas helleri TaxID=1608996 RepID=UPI003FD02E43